MFGNTPFVAISGSLPFILKNCISPEFNLTGQFRANLPEEFA